MNAYQKEQAYAYQKAIAAMRQLPEGDKKALHIDMQPYLAFRKELNAFLDKHFGAHCSQSCFENARSACCSKDGIIAFWADVVINVCHSTPSELEALFQALRNPLYPAKCVYLGSLGCLWRIRPLVCAMFLCDRVQETVFGNLPSARAQWEAFRNRARSFRWPDQPVLFDKIELLCMAQGFRSPLMYINTSPGLLRIKQRAEKLCSDSDR